MGGRGGDWIQTYSGRQFWPMDPRPEDVHIEDVAHALSLLCRYGGHVLRFYSVAEHCVHLARAVPREDALWALLHDASEAYLVDVPRPIKSSLGGYREAEAKIMAAVCERFSLHPEQPASVGEADYRILTDERVQNMAPAPVAWSTDAAPLGITLSYWSPSEARALFLHTFHRLSNSQAAA